MEVVVAYSRFYPDICLQHLRKTMENLCQDESVAPR
jgi:hypothetical protein